MTTGVITTKGTRLYFLAGDSAGTIHAVACATGITGLGGAADQIDITCLTSEEREFSRGMLNPGTLNVPINFIPRSESHQALMDLRESGATVSWMIVFSDQNGTPNSIDSSDRIVSPGATSAEFLGYLSDFNIDIATNEIVRGTLTIQRSGAVDWTFPSTDLVP